jgi:hypothetical protein
VCLEYLRDGSFVVRGTVRDPENVKRIEPLKTAFGEELFSKLELAKADLMSPESIDAAV